MLKSCRCRAEHLCACLPQELRTKSNIKRQQHTQANKHINRAIMWSARSSVCSCRSACSCESCSCDSPSTCSCVTSRYVQQSYQPQRSFRVSQQQRVHYERQERPQSARARSRPSPARALPQRQARPARRASVSGAAASAHVPRRAATAGAKSRPMTRTRTRTRNSRAVSRSDGYTTSFGTTKPQYESKHCTK